VVCVTLLQEYSSHFFNGYFDVVAITELLQSTNVHQHRKIKKKDREKQRHGFKDTLSALQAGTSPTVTLTINGQQFVFSDWKAVKRLSSFRHLLGTGFHTHMRHNKLLSDIFDITIQHTPIIQKSEKQNAMAANLAEAKDRSQRIKAGRYAKAKRSDDGADQQ